MQRKTDPTATLPAKTPTWTGMGLKSSLCGESLADNRLTNGKTERLISIHVDIGLIFYAYSKSVNNQLKFGRRFM